MVGEEGAGRRPPFRGRSGLLSVGQEVPVRLEAAGIVACRLTSCRPGSWLGEQTFLGDPTLKCILEGSGCLEPQGCRVTELQLACACWGLGGVVPVTT